MALALPFDRASSIQGERLAWAIERYAAGELTAEQVEATHEFDPGYGLANQLRRFRSFRRPIDDVLSAELGETDARAIVRSGSDEAVVRVKFGDAPERRILAMVLMKRPPQGVTTRLAVEADGPALRDLERRCAVETGGVSVYYDRGDDYFAQQRLMLHHSSIVAEYEGHVVGLTSDAIRYVRIGGARYRTTYAFHLRVDPQARGLNILPALNFATGDTVLTGRPLPIRSSFIAAHNTQMLETIGGAQREALWDTTVERMILPCGALTGKAFGRPAGPEDAARIAYLLSSSHGAEELALDFDERSVTERLMRSPGDYSWSDVVLSEGAVLGVWDSGLSIVRTSADRTTKTRTATVMDWGFTTGNESQMEALLRGACTRLASAGVDDLVIFSSPPSRGRGLLAGLARIVEPFRIFTAGVEPTADAVNGVYVDPIYF